MRCPNCGFENPDGLKFCNECGAPLRIPRCPSVGLTIRRHGPSSAANAGRTSAASQPQRPMARPHAPLSYTPAYLAEKILTSKAALEGERKQVTVLFADLKGSMELLADRDPEDARQLLDPVLERMMAAVHRYEGTVNQVMGDGIMALFGAPIAHEDHAVRACYAALRHAGSRAANTVRRCAAPTASPVHIRVGLNSGEVVVRAIGNDLHMDYSAIGQTTHLAARMEQTGHAGQHPADGRDPAAGRGPGAGQRPGAGARSRACRSRWRCLSWSAPVRVRQRLQAAAARGLTRFVGRETELAALAQALARAGDGPRPSRGRWWGRPAWGSPACCTSSSTRTAPRAGWCWRPPRSRTAKPRPTSRSSTCSSATCTSRTATSRGPSGPK